jgi:predicted HTH domain antitoxin
MSNKNAYEIRLELLRMAHDDLVGQYNHKIGVATNEAYNNKQEFDITLIESLFPKSEDILVRAAELYKFVENSH